MNEFIIEEKILEYLIRMAHKGADEEIGSSYILHHTKINKIEKEIFG